jgi:putative ABC transport system permease protein
MDLLLKDLRHAAGRLARSPGFCAVVLATLAVGIGANLAIFGVVDRLLLRPLPYPDAERVVMLWSVQAAKGEERGQVSYPDVHDWRAQARSFEALAPFDDGSLVLSVGGDPERLPAALVGRGFFRALGVEAALGRTFVDDEDRPGRNQVVVVSDALWRRLGGDPAIVGRVITVSGVPHEVVGVLPAGYEPPPASVIEEPAIYKPLAREYDPARHSARHMRAIGRLRAGVGLAQAQAEMDAVAAGLARALPDQNQGIGVRIASLAGERAHGARGTLVLLLAAVGLVLLLACANVAHMVLARALDRRREMAIRRALGASGGRLARLMMVEALLVAVLGTGLGLGLAALATDALAALAVSVLPGMRPLTLDWRLAAFAGGAALATAVLVGLPLAWQARAAEPVEAMAEGGRAVVGAPARRFDRLLIAGEIATAFVLLSAAGLTVRSLSLLSVVDPGFRTAGAVAQEVWLPGARYPEDEQHPRFFAALEAKVAALPGVEAVGVVSNLALSGNFDRVGVEIEGRGAADTRDMERYVASPGYFAAAGVPLVRGRRIEPRDDAGAPAVALVGASTAARTWPGEDPIGKRLRLSGRWFEVVGVVGDVRHYGLDAAPSDQVYLAQAQYPSQGMVIVARGPAPEAIPAAVRGAVRSLDPELPLFNVRALDAVVADSLATRRLAAALLSAFAGAAVFLAVVGISGVVTHAVGRRSREIGLRMALGARRAQVVAGLLRQGATPIAGGLALGLLGALAAGRALSGLLYGVTRHDPATLALTAIAIAAVAVLATYLPARRAAGVDPLVVLRSE